MNSWKNLENRDWLSCSPVAHCQEGQWWTWYKRGSMFGFNDISSQWGLSGQDGKMVGGQWWWTEPSDPLQPRTPPEWSHRFPKVGRMSKNYLKFPTQIISILNLDQLKGTVLQMINFCLNLIFWIVMGGGIARFGRRGLKTTETWKFWSQNLSPGVLRRGAPGVSRGP